MAGEQGSDTIPPGLLPRLNELAVAAVNGWKLVLPVTPLGPIDGPKCLVVPGFLASDRTTLELRRAFADAGWRTIGWGMGLNRGAKADTLVRLRRRFEEVGQGEKLLLVGWSLGGVFARELAREVPDHALAVVTLGSPFSGDPRWNNVWRMYELVAGHKVDSPPVTRDHRKPPVPTLALWSRRDGIVAPRAAYGLAGERDSAIEVDTTHLGFAVTRSGAAAVVAETLQFLRNSGLNIPPN